MKAKYDTATVRISVDGVPLDGRPESRSVLPPARIEVHLESDPESIHTLFDLVLMGHLQLKIELLVACLCRGTKTNRS